MKIIVGHNKNGLVLTRGSEQWTLTLGETDQLLTEIAEAAEAIVKEAEQAEASNQ